MEWPGESGRLAERVGCRISSSFLTLVQSLAFPSPPPPSARSSVSAFACGTGRRALWVNGVRPCRSSTVWRTNDVTALATARLVCSETRQSVAADRMRRRAAVRLTHCRTGMREESSRLRPRFARCNKRIPTHLSDLRNFFALRKPPAPRRSLPLHPVTLFHSWVPKRLLPPGRLAR